MIHQLIKEQFLKSNIDEVWDFVSSPKNLKKITPPYMGFNIISNDLKEKMYPGMIIIYKVSPIFKIPITWVTEITQISEKKYKQGYDDREDESLGARRGAEKKKK